MYLASISIVSSGDMLVKKESTPRLPIKTSESCSTDSSAKANESFFCILVTSQRL